MSESHFISLLSKVINSAELHFHCVHFQSDSGELQSRKKKKDGDRMEMESDCVIIDGHLLGHLTLSYSHTCEEQNVFTFSPPFVLSLIVSPWVRKFFNNQLVFSEGKKDEVAIFILCFYAWLCNRKKLFNISSCLNGKYVNGKYVDAFYNI